MGHDVINAGAGNLIQVTVTTALDSDSATPTSPDAAAGGSWQLGDRTVHRLGFGAMRLTGTAAFHGGAPRDRATSIAVLRRAVELGVNHVDTAAFYFSAPRSANEIISAALAPFGDEVLVATKVGPRRDRAGSWENPARPQDLRGDVEENLRQLGRDHLDLVYLRNMRWESIAEHFGVLAELRESGLVRHLGVSEVTPAQLAQARAIAPVAAVQNRFGLGHSDAAELLRVCGRAGIAFVPFFAIAGSRAAGAAPAPDGDGLDETVLDHAVSSVAKAHGATPAQIRLAWTLAQGPHVLAIPGTGDPAHLEANVAAAAIRLSARDLEALGSAA